MGSSAISWTDHTLNPGIYGCSRFGVGCDHCYAIEAAKGIERKTHGDTLYAGVSDGKDWIAPVRIVPATEAAKRILAVPKRRDGQKRKVFVTSMADFLHESIPLEWIVECIVAMASKPLHIWQVLTKRGHRWPAVAAAVVARLGAWPRNVWAGLSVAHQPDTRLIRHLLEVPGVRFLSCEPLIGPVELPDAVLAGLDWVIVGGESQAGARPMDLAWARSLRDQCQTAGVWFFLKQLGGHPNARADIAGTPADLQIQEVPDATDLRCSALFELEGNDV